jgi:hypothetical protein
MIRFCLIVAALIHLLPVIGVESAARLKALYGVAIDGPDLAILMRHRAVLFAILGSVMLAAAFRTELRSVAIVAGLASVVSFIALALATPGYNARIGAVLAVDLVALIALVVAAGLHFARR